MDRVCGTAHRLRTATLPWLVRVWRRPALIWAADRTLERPRALGSGAD